MKEQFNFHNSCPLHLAAISAKQAKFCLSVFHTLQQKLPALHNSLQEYTFLLAVSGGIDSLAMLALFAACQKHFGYQIEAAHFNHGIRKESFAEEKLMQKICKRLAVPLFMERGNTPLYAKEHKMGLEEAGRILRYDFFAALQKEKSRTILCTAHHAQDLCEDVLMRLIRGSVWPQLAGMPYFDEKRQLLRPVLYVTKKELMDLLLELDIPFANDTSNTDEQFMRNRMRKNIIPLLEKENPQFFQNIIKLNQNAQYDKLHFQKEVDKVLLKLERTEQCLSLPIALLQEQDKTIRMHTYHALLEKLGQGHAVNASFENLDDAIMKNQGKTCIKFSNNVRMQIRDKKLFCSISAPNAWKNHDKSLNNQAAARICRGTTPQKQAELSRFALKTNQNC